MARGSKSAQPPQDPATLRIPRDEARAQIQNQIDAGKQLIAAPTNALAAGAVSEAAYDRWTDFNRELLRRIFTAGDFVAEYDFTHYKEPGNTVQYGSSFRGTPRPSWQSKVPPRIECLQSILDRLRLIEALDPTPSPASKALRAYDGLELHPEIERRAGKLFRDGHHAGAVEAACKALNGLVQLRSGRDDLDGAPLMMKVFSVNDPEIAFNALKDESDRSEQQGLMHLFAGAMLAFRNPRAHKFVQDHPERALERIRFVSLLAKLLDDIP